MATFSYGVLPLESTGSILQANQSYGAQYQSNGFNNASWHQEYITNWSAVQSGSVSLPGVGSRQNGYTLYTTKVDEMELGYAKVTLDWIYQPTVVPPTAYSMEGAVEEKPIELNPQFGSMTGWNYTTGKFNQGSPWYGITSYKAPTVAVTVTSYSTSQPSLDMSSMPNGKLQVPGGSFTGDYTHWLCITNNITLQGALWITVTTYSYDGDGYDTTVYQAA